MIRKRTNAGFSMVELILAIAIMVILAGALAPQLIKYINKSRRARDVDAAGKIRDAFNMVLVDEKGDVVLGSSADSAVSLSDGNIAWTRGAAWNTTPQTFLDKIFNELGTVPVSSTRGDYWWLIQYDAAKDMQIQFIYLVPNDGSAVQYELYPDSKQFLENGI